MISEKRPSKIQKLEVIGTKQQDSGRVVIWQIRVCTKENEKIIERPYEEFFNTHERLTKLYSIVFIHSQVPFVSSNRILSEREISECTQYLTNFLEVNFSSFFESFPLPFDHLNICFLVYKQLFSVTYKTVSYTHLTLPTIYSV
eukprot:TRINITY_DN20302_c0_g1_i1.p1 TRINITY_DN20302_c0_g1~~TRINITY_DN20302_c0_g1_i1.p1  ORF type:complete len:144 (-),score=18.45 TRINITY_DN20302_c0_g1_i1:31-462(-)